MRVVLDKFGGVVPRDSAHMLPKDGASVAHDVKIRNGRIEPWKEPCKVQDADATQASLHTYGCCIFTWENLVHATNIAPDWGRFYITGRSAFPEAVTVRDGCNVTYARLGVPAPTSAPITSAVESCERDSDARTYVYTFVNNWGEESAPSPASPPLVVSDGAVVNVAGMQLPPAGYDITFINIYRAATGFRSPSDKDQSKQTLYLLVGTIALPTNSFQDAVLTRYLGDPLETAKYRVPPAKLTNLVSITGSVRLAGTTGNQVHLSENFMPFNWPSKYDLTLDSNIVHMVAIDQRLYVTTDTTPYIIDVSDCDDTKCIPVSDLEVPLPDIACVHANAAIPTPHGMLYSSPLGLTLIPADGRYSILTAKWFSADDWGKMKPDTVRLAYHEGFIFCVTDAVSFILNINGDVYDDVAGTEMVTISDTPTTMHSTSAGALLFLTTDGVYAWDKGHEYRPYKWESRQLTGGSTQPGQTPQGSTWSPASAKVQSPHTTFTLIDSRGTDVYTRKVLGPTPFRLPRVGRHMHFKVRLEGTGVVEFVDLGTAHFTVNIGA